MGHADSSSINYDHEQLDREFPRFSFDHADLFYLVP